MARLYWFRKRWAARLKSYTAFIFKLAIPSLLMAIVFVWHTGGLRDFSVTRLFPATPRVAPEPSMECQIKGNISDSGERIYHMPGSYYYDFTVVEEAKGERWFCAEAEAQAAGWRKSKL